MSSHSRVLWVSKFIKESSSSFERIKRCRISKMCCRRLWRETRDGRWLWVMFPRRVIETLLTSNLSFIVEAAETINFTTLFANWKQLLTLQPEIYVVFLFPAGTPESSEDFRHFSFGSSWSMCNQQHHRDSEGTFGHLLLLSRQENHKWTIF